MLEGQIKECDSYKKLITSFMIPEHEKIEKQKKKEAIIALNDVINYVRRENVNNIYFSNDDYENLISQASDLEKEGIYNDSEISASIIDRYQKINDHFRTIFFNDSTILELLDPLADMQNSNIEQKVLAYKENIERHRKFDYITFVWSNLSIMTAPHEQMSRYPSEKEPQKLDDLYNLELPIVKYTPQIVELLEKSIDISTI